MAGAIMDKVWGLFGGVDQGETEEYDDDDVYEYVNNLFWNDYNPKEKRVMPVKMPARYLAEMFCDRLAASKVYAGDQYQQDHSLRYFQNSNARKRGMLHPETEAKLMELLEILAQQGEEAAFAAVRELVKKGY